MMIGHAKQWGFPLYLTPLETFMWLDDRPAYPMTFLIHMEFSGTVDRAAFEAALGETLARHPLLNAFVQRAKRNRLCWVLAEGAMPRLDWADQRVPIECPQGEAIDIGSQIGLRVWVRQGEGTARVLFQFHHACVDGTGAYRFLGDLLAAYGRRTAPDGKRPEPGPVDPKLLRIRKYGIMDLALRARAPTVAWAAVWQAVRVLGRRASPLRAPHSPCKRDRRLAPFPGIESYHFDEAEYKQIRLAAVESGVTVNDLLLCELFHAVREWNSRHGGGGRFWSPGGRRRRIGIMMPTDLRDGDHYEMPAANMTSYTFLVRRAGACDRADELLRSIRDETSQIKNQRLGTRFVDMLAAALSVRGLLRVALSGRRCLSTAVLSNVGDPTRRFTARLPRDKGRVVAGNLVLERITGVPPLRPKTRAAIIIITYRRQLTVSMRCDPYLFRPEDTREQLAIYVERLRRAAGLSTSTRSMKLGSAFTVLSTTNHLSGGVPGP